MEAIKIRLRNPFFASFIFSWLIWNWKIWIGLFWHNDHSLEKAGYVDFIDFVQGQLSFSSSLIYPLISALLLVLLLPLIRNLMEMYQAFMMNWGERKVMDISKTGSISIDKYIRKKQQILTYVNEIREAAADEDEFISKISQNEEEIGQLKATRDHMLIQLQGYEHSIKNNKRVRLLEGNWRISPGLRGSGSEEYHFYGQEIRSITHKGDGDLFGNVLYILEHDLEMHCVVKNNFSDILYLYLQISMDLLRLSGH
jgi:hypothetical protein